LRGPSRAVVPKPPIRCDGGKKEMIETPRPAAQTICGCLIVRSYETGFTSRGHLTIRKLRCGQRSITGLKYLKMTPDYQAKKKQSKQLRQKLFHIKRLVKIYDQGLC
ncbi:unnamed protein product, partial [Pleuronectes platessa]